MCQQDTPRALDTASPSEAILTIANPHVLGVTVGSTEILPPPYFGWKIATSSSLLQSLKFLKHVGYCSGVVSNPLGSSRRVSWSVSVSCVLSFRQGHLRESGPNRYHNMPVIVR
jgi:hypothetical protein